MSRFLKNATQVRTSQERVLLFFFSLRRKRSEPHKPQPPKPESEKPRHDLSGLRVGVWIFAGLGMDAPVLALIKT